MRILMTNHRMGNPGGTELFVLEVAAALKALGHEVCVFSTVAGGISARLEEGGIAFVTDPCRCPFEPEIIHGQHHLEAMTALCAWPRTPAIYFVHGATPWEESAPRHPRIARYLGTSPRFGWMVARACGIKEEELVVAPNFFDAKRFDRIRDSNAKTGRALVFHNTLKPGGPAHAALQQACNEAGLMLEGAGVSFGRVLEHPETELPNYDVVFAGGRSAIEAMACGCAVIPVTAEQSGEWVRPENYDDMAMRNFTAEINAPPADAAEILRELRQITPAAVAAVTRRIRSEARIERTLEILLESYRAAIAASLPEDPAAEAQAVGAYLLNLAQRVKEVDDKRAELLEQKHKAQARAERWKKTAGEQSALLRWLAGETAGGSFLRRLWWRLMTRSWRRRRAAK